VPDLGIVDLGELTSRWISAGRLDEYFRLLMQHNRKINLVSRETDRVSFDRMVGESLVPLDHVTTPVRTYLDIGAGGGIPSIPLLLAGVVSGEAKLIERTIKKARELSTIVEKLGLSAEVIARNFEELDNLSGVDLITLRYVKLNPILLRSVFQVLCTGGSLVYYGPTPEDCYEFKVVAFSFRSIQDSVVKSITIFQK
jgi:16S rRNA G527 N7-methylase RsmG